VRCGDPVEEIHSLILSQARLGGNALPQLCCGMLVSQTLLRAGARGRNLGVASGGRHAALYMLTDVPRWPPAGRLSRPLDKPSRPCDREAVQIGHLALQQLDR